MSETKTGKERRKDERCTQPLPYTLVIDSEHYSGVTGNISRGGLYTETISPPIAESLMGQNGKITLQLDSESIVTECMIVYVGGGTIPYPTGVGISFLDPEQSILVKALEKIIQKNS